MGPAAPTLEIATQLGRNAMPDLIQSVGIAKLFNLHAGLRSYLRNGLRLR